MWSDNESNVDYLNFEETADQVVRLVRDPRLLPIAVGVFGGWGAGKSTVLNLAEKRLSVPKKGDDRIVVVRFDAWLFQSYDDARTALTETIAKELQALVESDEGLTQKLGNVVKRVRWLKVIARGAELGLSLAAGVPVPISAAVRAGQAVWEGTANADDVEALKNAGATLSEEGKGILKDAPERSIPAEILALRREFADLLNELTVVLVVIIDNLDRCLPSHAIATLEAIRLVLFVERTAFVIAADEDMVRHAVRKHYEGPMERHVKDYLDKLIQVPIRVPLPGVLDVQAYITQLLLEVSGAKQEVRTAVSRACVEHLRTVWRQTGRLRESIEDACKGKLTSDQHNDLLLAERLAPVLAQSPEVLGNPRIVKRLFNVIRLRSELAKSRGMPLDEPILAKLAVFERCAGEVPYAYLCGLISRAALGKVELLANLEALAADGEKLAAALPEELKPATAFVQQWLALPPALAAVDLRGALYLSRSSFAVRSIGDGMDAAEQSAVAALVEARTVNSPAAKAAAASLQPRQALHVMDALVNVLRGHADWQAVPQAIYGCVVLAEVNVAAAPRLVAYLKGIQPEPKWLAAMLKGKSWWRGA
jgi:predicted KAP-like P-loop ATPase